MYYRFTFEYGEVLPATAEPGSVLRRTSFAFMNPFMYGGQDTADLPAESGNVPRRTSWAGLMPFTFGEQATTPAPTGLKRRSTYAIPNPFKHQKTSPTSTEPGCNERRIMSKELVDEWFNTIHDGFGSRHVATAKVKDVMTPTSTEGNIHTRYDLDVYKKYGSNLQDRQ
jgi:hypothetical protein